MVTSLELHYMVTSLELTLRQNRIAPPTCHIQCPTQAVISDLYDNAIFLRIVKKLPNIKQ